MNLALFGGTFDPVHNGHLQLARSAAVKFDLKQVHFIPAYIPPHKQRQPITAFEHRFAMLALATLEEKLFVPSLLEAPSEFADAHAGSHAGKQQRRGHEHEHDGGVGANYSIDTVRRVKHSLRKSDRLFFLIGIDAFQEIATWKDSEALLGECEFIVGSRPGYTLADVADALPQTMRPPKAVSKPFTQHPASGDLVLGKAHLHLLEGVNVAVSATQIRNAAAAARGLNRLVPEKVAEYIRKMGLYKRARAGGTAQAANPGTRNPIRTSK
jgi:nicotinate-nucleotide adenylyltransferase